MITVLLIVHGLLAVALLGAITHQALSVFPVRAAAGPLTFIGRFRSVDSGGYANAVVVLFVVTAIGGGLLYPQYRLDVRTALEDLQLRAANGVFEIKEHLVAIGLGLLPTYWLFWKAPMASEQAVARRYLTWLLAFIVWWSFLVGHVLNNIKGLFAVTTSNRRPSVEIFSMLFGIGYLACFYLDWAPFRYYPDTRAFHLKATPQDGPAILWYGWVAAAVFISAAVAVLVPRSLAERLRPGWSWVVPLAIVILLLIYERRWFV